MNHIQVETIFLNLIRQTEEFISAIVGMMPANDSGSFSNRLTTLFDAFKSDKAAFTASSTQLGFLATLLKEYAAFRKQSIEDIGTPEILLTVPKWGDIYDKPATFPPSEHTHTAQPVANVAWNDITEKPTTFAPADHSHPAQVVAWADVTDKPTTFAPDAHSHPAQVVAWTDVTEKPTTFAPRMAAIRYLGNGATSRVISFEPAFLASAVMLRHVSSNGFILGTLLSSPYVDLTVPGQITITVQINPSGAYYDAIIL